MYQSSPNSPAEAFILEELGGITLTLKDRMLPYRPVRIEGKQRADFTWYPGSPEATVQMLGPEEGAIRLNGFWKDRFFERAQSVTVGDSTELTRGRNAGFAVDVTTVDNVAALAKLIDNMRRMGRQITLKWSGLERVGHITSFAQTWHNVHDVEWEIEFSVLSQGEKTVPVVDAIAPSVQDAYQTAYQAALELRQQIINASGLPQWVALTTKANLAISGAELIVQATAGAISDVARGYADGVFSTTQAARRTVATFTGAIVNLGIQGASIYNSAIDEVFSFGIYGSQDNAPMGAQLSANSFQRQYQDIVRKSRYSFSLRRRQAAQAQATANAQVQATTPPNGTDLRTVSQRFYGTPDNWRKLMTYNGLQDSNVSGGVTIYIPPANLLDVETGT